MVHRMVRATAPLTVVLALIVVAFPAAAAAAPAIPENPYAFTTQYDPRGPDGQVGLWVWDPFEYFFRAPIAWHFVPVARWSVTTSVDEAEPPAWPADVLTVQAIGVLTPREEILGFWLWNPYRFVGGTGGPHFWSPAWEWHVPPD